MEFPAVEEVEHLHHHECVEYEGEVPRVDVQLLVDYFVVFLPI